MTQSGSNTHRSCNSGVPSTPRSLSVSRSILKLRKSRSQSRTTSPSTSIADVIKARASKGASGQSAAGGVSDSGSIPTTPKSPCGSEGVSPAPSRHRKRGSEAVVTGAAASRKASGSLAIVARVSDDEMMKRLRTGAGQYVQAIDLLTRTQIELQGQKHKNAALEDQIARGVEYVRMLHDSSDTVQSQIEELTNLLAKEREERRIERERYTWSFDLSAAQAKHFVDLNRAADLRIEELEMKIK